MSLDRIQSSETCPLFTVAYVIDRKQFPADLDQRANRLRFIQRALLWTGMLASIRTRSSCTRLLPQVSPTPAQTPRNAGRLTVASCM